MIYLFANASTFQAHKPVLRQVWVYLKAIIMQSPFILSAHQSADHIVSRIILNLETVEVLLSLIALKSFPYYPTLDW